MLQTPPMPTQKPKKAPKKRETSPSEKEPKPVVAMRLSPKLVAELDAWAAELNATSFGRVTRTSLAERILIDALKARAATRVAGGPAALPASTQVAPWVSGEGFAPRNPSPGFDNGGQGFDPGTGLTRRT